MGWTGLPINVSANGSDEKMQTSSQTCRYEDYASNKMSMLPNCPQGKELADCLMHGGKTCTPQSECPNKCPSKDALFLGSGSFVQKQSCLSVNKNEMYNFYRLPDGSECYKKAA